MSRIVYQVDGRFYEPPRFKTDSWYHRSYNGRIVPVSKEGRWPQVEPVSGDEIRKLAVRNPLGQVTVKLKYDRLYIPK